MIEKYKIRYISPSKNPFLGEDKLLFLHSPEPDVPQVTASERFHAEIQSGLQPESAGEFIKLFPDDDIKEELQASIDDYQFLRGGLTYIERIKRYLESSTDGIDTGHLPWSRSVDAIAESFAQLEEQVDSLNLNIDQSILRNIRNEQESEQRRQMVEIFNDSYERIQQELNEKTQKIHKLYVIIYMEKYDELAAKWEGAPNIYKNYAAHKKAIYQECKNHLMEEIEKQIPIGEEDKLLQMLKNYKNILSREERELISALSEVNNEVDISTLRMDLDQLNTRKNKEFESSYGIYIYKINAILSRLIEIEREIQNSTELDDTERISRLKKIKDLKEGYEKNLRQADEFKATDFSDPNPFMEKNEDGEYVPKSVKGIDGSDVPMPKGLKDRVELMLSGFLPPDVVNVLADGIKKEIRQINAAIDGFIDDVENNLDTTLIGLQNESIEGPITTPSCRIDYSVVWMSPLDVWKMIENAGESFKRSFERTRQRKVGKVGSVITKSLEHLNWGPFAHFSVIPGDLDKLQTRAENEAVSHYQEDYKSNDDMSVISLLHNARNQDQFKACIQLLAERGRVNWFDPRFLKQLNAFQNIVHFDLTKEATYHAKETEFYRSLEIALDAIYGDADFFRNMQAQNQSAYNSGKEKFKSELINMSRARGGLQKVAVEMLKEHWQSGGNSTVNPQKFEYVIELGVMEGAVQPAETGLYFLIQAAHCGLLPFERLHAIYANHSNDIPYLEIFNEGVFNAEILKKWASIDPPPDSFETLAAMKCPHKFMRWFHTFVMHHPRVRNRCAKVISGGRNMDSDLQALFLSYASENSVTNLLTVHADGSHAEEWLLNNASQFQLFALHNTITTMDEMEDENEGKFDGVDPKVELSNIISAFIKWDSVMSNRMYNNRRMVRWTDSLKKQGPRSGYFFEGIYWDGKNEHYKTTYGYALRAREIIMQLDEELFSIIFKHGEPSIADVERVVQIAREKYQYNFDGNPPSTADKMYEQIAGLIGAVIAKQSISGGTLQSLSAKIKSENEQFFQENKILKEDISFYPNLSVTNRSQESDFQFQQAA